ncbi:hypothetical protein ACE1B6_21520 [Aerosakkonemataceae cyanobacterium BLCC-F154]|uniref:Uncharacterized protein n=1 Tax=Floridaenema fluviatile BLCC-F154 TaxID=3153640 RepID=A0ABV4YG86_9CYAN
MMGAIADRAQISVILFYPTHARSIHSSGLIFVIDRITTEIKKLFPVLTSFLTS